MTQQTSDVIPCNDEAMKHAMQPVHQCMSLTVLIATIKIVKVHVACRRITRLWNNADVMLVYSVTSRSRTLQMNYG